jgi:hypothetical protein
MEAPPESGTGTVQFAEFQAPDSPWPRMEFAEADGDLPHDSDETLLGVAVRYVPAEAPVPEPFPAPQRRASAQTVAPAMAPPAAEAPPTPVAVAEIPAFPAEFINPAQVDDLEDVTRARKLRQQRAKRKRLIMAAGGVGALVLSVGIFASLSPPSKKDLKKGPATVAKSKPASQEESEPGGTNGAAGEDDQKGEPITLNFVPDGARILIHMRPADLWQNSESAAEFRACLGPLGVWIEKTVKEKCELEPAKVEEALFALIPVSRDSFEVAVVVRGTGELKRSELITKFDGELVDTPKPHYVGKEKAWIIGGSRVFASCPAGMAASLAESIDTPSTTSDGVQALLSMTDRRRHFTLVCDLEDVRLGAKTLAPDNAQKLLEGIVDFFGDDVDAICWSLQLGDKEGGNNLQSQVLVRNRLSRTPAKLQGDLKKKLAQLPAEVLEIVRMTQPKQIGEKKVVGRYPVMTKIVEQKTRFDTGHRLVSMKVDLPERAGPNLALGTLLTWYQTTLPGYGSSPAPTIVAKANLPDKVVDRLKKKITVDYRREFLYNAVEFISEETSVAIKLDGPGMKEIGITQNEYQTFAMEDVPATAVLQKILGPKNLVLIIDEQNKSALITSMPVVERKKLTPFPLEPASK